MLKFLEKKIVLLNYFSNQNFKPNRQGSEPELVSKNTLAIALTFGLKKIAN